MRFYVEVLALVIVLRRDVTEGLRPSTGHLLEKSLTSLERLLFFFHSRVDQMSLDSALGVAIAKGQISSALRGTSGRSSPPSKRILKNLFALQYRCSTLLQLTQDILLQNNRSGFVNLGRLLDPWYWDTDTRRLECDKSSERSPPNFVSKQRLDLPDGPSSDGCLADILARPCEGVEPICWREEFAPEASAATGYALTHRLIYAHVARKEPYCMGKRRPELDVILCSICRKILREAKMIADHGYPTIYRDLFMEQVALCGLENFTEFANPLWLHHILSWQHPSGCYGNTTKLRKGVSLNRSILKRSESIMDYGCLSHASGVALASLAVNIRFMVISL